MTKNARFSLLPSFIIVSAALLAGCNDQGEAQAHPAEPQVTVHVVEKAPLAVHHVIHLIRAMGALQIPIGTFHRSVSAESGSVVLNPIDSGSGV